MDLLLKADSKSLDKLTKVERIRLNSLTLRSIPNDGFGPSLMRVKVLHRKNNLDKVQIFTISDNEKIIAWCSVFLNYGKYNIYVYVMRSYRRKGIGSSLVNSAIKWATERNIQYRVFPWDRKSRGFYKKILVKSTKESK